MTAAAFWDRVAPRYARMAVRDPDAYADTLARVRARLRPGDRVLEVGCGTGATALALAAPDIRIEATDAAPGMIAIARERPNPHGVAFAVAELAQAGVDAPAFDVVAAFNLLHLTPDPKAAAATLRARLRPGGLFLSKTPLLGEAAAPIRALIPALRLFGLAPPGLSHMTTTQLDAAIAGAGFEIVETHAYPGRAPTRYVAARRV